MKTLHFSLLWLSTLLSLMSGEQTSIQFFEQQVRPVLVEHCYPCHSAEAKKLKGNLYLDSKAGWEKGGDSGKPVIVPGKPEDSLFIRSIQHLEADLEMPPKKPKLSDGVIADLITWVKMGAPDPRDGVKTEAKRGDKTWWSLQPLKKEFAHNNIDDFIVAQLAEKKLALNPPADPRALIRRMTYDVIGLPPTPAEVESFVQAHQANPSQAIIGLVDRLLASQRYGERWGRHWLDVIRFGESNGFERNFVIDDLWPFRDYVIKSINDDKPFNQFIIEHLAGDVIGKDDPSVEIGSAFLVAGPYDDVGNQSIVAQKNIRAATIDDMITATSSAVLGLTINCARCHNHKFDPIPTEDYYRLRAAFEGIKHGRRVIATKDERATYAAATNPLNQQLKQLTAERDALNKNIDERAKNELTKRTSTRAKIDPLHTEERFTPVQARQVKFVIHSLTTIGKNGRLSEFEVWSSGAQMRNVALAVNGGKAEGARSSVAEDFPEAYGPQFTIDGRHGEQWFIGNPAELTITFAEVETIDRVVFSNALGENDKAKEDQKNNLQTKGGTPCDYDIQVSNDGKNWHSVANSDDREPWTPAHGIERIRQTMVTTEEQQHLAGLNKQISQVQTQINRIPKLPQVWAGTYSEVKEPTYVHKGGDPMKPGAAVVPASLSVLDQITKPYTLKSDASESERRLALAQWLVTDNPLTARVLANRVWHYHFGTGIVDTPSDFGFLGSQPTHPELLDYLAQRLIANDWKIKGLHREILLSQTYQQSSAYRGDAAKIDKDARQLWRFPPRRLSAEELRDTMLAVAGKLQLEPMGGPGFQLYKVTQNNVSTYFPLDSHGPKTYRRSVYHQNARASIVDVLNDFDLPDISFASPKRANTTTPLQTLTLFNHSFTLDMAKALAVRMQTGNPVTQAYHLTFQRDPTAKEHEAAKKLIATHGAESFCRALLNANELLYLE